MKGTALRLTAKTILLTLIYQLVAPVYSYALTTGPSQPEVQSFEPVGTTDMVNTFTGDFTYNIPLLDVEGYPVNISYHSGVTMEQESTWCGLGWNINPGEINRSVRGLPDDFNGERIEREIHIEPEKNIRVGTGANLGLEILGKDNSSMGVGFSFSLGMYVNYNNYRGLSAGVNTGVSVNTPVASTGIDMGIGSQSGADIDVNASVTISGKVAHDVQGGITVGVGSGFNSRQGLKDLGFNVSASAKSTISVAEKDQSGTKNDKGQYPDKVGKDGKTVVTNKQQGGTIGSYGSSVKIGLQNYVPVITNASITKSFSFQLKGGAEFSMLYPNLFFNAQISNTDYQVDGTRRGFGYLYSENADDYAILDFTRDKDGIYNRTLTNLPLSASTYDVYSVSGQGTGGSFRPFRNDIGTFYDPLTESKTKSDDVQLEFGLGNLFEAGGDANFYDNSTKSGPWTKRPFKPGTVGKLFEKVFFKAGGELTYNSQLDNIMLSSPDPMYVREDGQTLAGANGGSMGSLPSILGTDNDRTTRANFISYLTAGDAAIKDVSSSTRLNYFRDNDSGNIRFYDPVEQSKERYAANDYQLKADQIGEFTQTLQDGRRYVYGLPALNHMSREVSFSVNENNANLGTGLVKFTPGSEDSRNNSEGRERYYNSSITPAQAHSYLLTSVLSTDYVDVLGDGPTDDDLGSFVKFNYNLWNDDYRWRAPYQADSAQYNAGYYSDTKDGKGSYAVGSRQVWQLRSIESKNYIAEFYVSARADGQGVKSAVLPDASKMTTPTGVNLKATLSSAGSSFKVDSIRLYNKHDRYIHENGAVPIKTVIFKYDYSLCKNIPNTNSAGQGKLTLKNIYIRYGNSDKNLLSPYSFSYNTPNPDYTFLAKDKWGNYKPTSLTGLTNYEFPYAAQHGAGVDSAAAWNMSDVKLPSGGVIHVDYESKDYAFVQDKRAMQMFNVVGLGASTNFERKSTLYQDRDNVNDYVYFKRDKTREVNGLSIKDNYLEEQSLLYYCFNLDITGNGKYEYIKSYARIESVDVCPNNSDYGYIKLKRDDAGGMLLHPATKYGLNVARSYLPHILYPGSGDGSDIENIVNGLIGAAEELGSIGQNPFGMYVGRGNAKKVRLEKSWLRLHSPGLTKKGGGIRVRKLTLTDNWAGMTGSQGENASYGKVYDYTIQDKRYGVISSGVASYEPLVGGDENPFRVPASSYQSDAGKGLPATDFFQEEPFGESLFPPAIIGYSSVKVRSIHANEGRSSQAVDEYLYYTSKDFPIEVAYTGKDAPAQQVDKSLRNITRREKVLQGYLLRFNDMHGKPKAINNYVIKMDGTSSEAELITGTKYNYNIDNLSKLSNKVRALVRNRGANNSYDIKDNVLLGQETDFSVDSRENYAYSHNNKIQLNVNATIYGIIPVVIPTGFFPDKTEEQDFKTMVTTKVIQQYGIVKSVEHYDHGATTSQENMVFDAESGDVLLSRVNNEFNESTYDLTYPAHLAYMGMGPAYMNAGYEEIADSLTTDFKGELLYVKNRSIFVIGDELLLTYTPAGGSERSVKVWTKATKFNCGLLVEPRYKYDAASPIWPDWTGKLTNVRVKILRSGRKNMLKSVIQQTTLIENPYYNSISDLLGGSSAFNKVLSVSGTIYSDKSSEYSNDSMNYGGFSEKLNLPAGDKSGFNDYVMGTRGIYKPRETFNGIEKRAYNDGHIRYDGTYAIPQVWENRNHLAQNCLSDQNIITLQHNLARFENSYLLLYSTFNRGMFITNDDPFGNVIEDLSLLVHFSAAQYGYNTALPVAVAKNASQSEFFFDGFESYAMLQSDNIRRLRFGSAYLFTPFASLFISPKSLSAVYSSANSTVPGFDGSINIRRGGQNYAILDQRAFINNALSSNLMITDEASHTGYFSLKSTGNVSIPILTQQFSSGLSSLEASQGSKRDWIFNRYHLPLNKKCVIDMWVKPTSGSNSQNQVSLTVAGGSTIPLHPKSSNIDGWYLVEAVLDYHSVSGTPTAYLNVPTGAYIDDVRIQPIDASVKSFVYSPYNFKLMAQLDENHIATFYEYDQEGLLIRTKKETSQGILTLSESRRANAKK